MNSGPRSSPCAHSESQIALSEATVTMCGNACCRTSVALRLRLDAIARMVSRELELMGKPLFRCASGAKVFDHILSAIGFGAP